MTLWQTVGLWLILCVVLWFYAGQISPVNWCILGGTCVVVLLFVSGWLLTRSQRRTTEAVARLMSSAASRPFTGRDIVAYLGTNIGATYVALRQLQEAGSVVVVDRREDEDGPFPVYQWKAQA